MNRFPGGFSCGRVGVYAVAGEGPVGKVRKALCCVLEAYVTY